MAKTKGGRTRLGSRLGRLMRGRGLVLGLSLLAVGLACLWIAIGTEKARRGLSTAFSPPVRSVVKLPEPRKPASSAPEPRAPRPNTAGPAAPGTAHPALWRLNAVHAAIASGRPMIAIVIDDVGVDKRRSERALALPAPLTMAFLPYAHDLPHMTAEARARGHELLVHVPMEPMAGDKDAGPEPLLDTLQPAEIRRRLDWMLGRFGSYVGVNNHMGSRMTRNPRAMRVVLEDLNERGLMFLDSRTTAETVGPKIARELGMPVVERDVFLDNDQGADQVRQQLRETERVAARKGHAIAIGHPHDGTLDALSAWLPEAEARGFVLVPVSAIVIEQEKLAKVHAGAVQ
jgi:polysaccharide deacetylase 2 family uncharacterized protein YibQ